jgi:aminoglycoside N3'-acetyltransferase/SAM-dependent methyltransferase
LEIGCGTGLLLFRIASRCTRYWGTDFSEVVLRCLQQQLVMSEQELPQVTLLQRWADDFTGVEAEAFDTVILNSVVQYFPGIDYLLHVLEGAMHAVAPGGYIFVGDVRSLPLLEAFYASAHCYQAPPSLSRVELRQRVHQAMAQEKELVIEPAFFTALRQRFPQIRHVDIRLKRGRYHNELTKFRYDVILQVGPKNAPTRETLWLDWQKERPTLSAVRQLLQEHAPEMVGLRRVPSARVQADLKMVEWLASDEGPATVGELRERLQLIQGEGVEPEELWALCDAVPYAVGISWSEAGADGCFDVAFRRRTVAEAAWANGVDDFSGKMVQPKPWSAYANNPLQGQAAHELVPQLRDLVQQKLPKYMMPSAFVLLDVLPLTPNGKVDRQALPAPDHARPELESSFVAPHDAFERQLTQMWEDLLGVTPIGVHDDFFELGGHSLLAVQLFAHIEVQMGIRLPLTTLFERPTVAHLAHCLRHQGEAAPEALPVEMPRERAVSDRISHPIARYLPLQYHPYVRRTYRRLKHSSLGRAVRGLYIRQGKNITQRLFSYTPIQLENQLKSMGISTGDTVLMHSAFRVFNGFAGTPDQVIACVLKVIGKSGTLVMVSLPYGGSTAAYLRAGVPFDVQQTRSAMGVITEIFRQTPGVVRSVNPAHPILAGGPAALWLIGDHEHTMYSCGKGSPFEKLVQLQAKALLFDVSLHNLTFFHYVKDQFQGTLPVKLYEEMPVESIVIDTIGRKKSVKSYVFSSESRRYHSQNLQQALIKEKVVKTERIGNTKLIVLQLPQVVEYAQHMVRTGKSLWKI